MVPICQLIQALVLLDCDASPAYPTCDLDDLLLTNKETAVGAMRNLLRYTATFGKFQGCSRAEFWGNSTANLLDTLQNEDNRLRSKRGAPMKAVMEAVKVPQDREQQRFFLGLLSIMQRQTLESLYAKALYGKPEDIH